MEYKEEEVIDITASIQIHSVQPKLLCFFMYRHMVDIEAAAYIWRRMRVGEREIHSHSKWLWGNAIIMIIMI